MTSRNDIQPGGSPLGALLFRGPMQALADQLARMADPNSEGRIRAEDLLPGAQDPLEGLIPDAFRPEITETFDWFSPTEWAGTTPGSEPPMDLSIIPAPGKGGVDGKGLDFFRGGEAPSNFTNRHNPLYQSRRRFAIGIADRIEDLFGVSAGGSAGYMRPPHPSDAAPGGRSANSDHYSGGAIDFTGDPAKLTALRNWLVDQPWVSFVRWQSESHTDHLHASIDIGWVAQNYFSGETLPRIAGPAPTLPTISREATSTTREPEPMTPPPTPSRITPGPI